MALRGIQEYIARDVNNIAGCHFIIARKRKLVGRSNSN